MSYSISCPGLCLYLGMQLAPGSCEHKAGWHRPADILQWVLSPAFSGEWGQIQSRTEDLQLYRVSSWGKDHRKKKNKGERRRSLTGSWQWFGKLNYTATKCDHFTWFSAGKSPELKPSLVNRADCWPWSTEPPEHGLETLTPTHTAPPRTKDIMNALTTY